MKTSTTLAALATAVAATLGASTAPAQAAASSATFDGTTATLNLDGADNNVTVSVANGLLVHGQAGGGLNSGTDWNSAAPGDQTVPANGTVAVVVNGGAGNDSITVAARTNEIASATLNGGAGDDVLTGADTADVFNAGDGNDRIVGGRGSDVMNGGAGNDTMVWNNGDGSDVMNGDDGNDAVEVNGSATAGDAFTMAPNAGRVEFQRTNLVPFTLNTSSERFVVNGLGGNDTLSSKDGVGALTQLSADGGAGDDTLTGTDGSDVIAGGEGNDTLSGGGGDDRLVGDRGSDTMTGGSGDDTLVWNNGDGSDVMNGGDGRDDIEVNGSPTAGDAFSVQPNGSRIKFSRTNLVPFTLDIGESETMHANGLGGDDNIAVGNVGGFSVTAAGGPGNDTLTGGSSSETFLGGSGNDTIAPGAGLDVVSGDDGNDTVNVRDNTADVATGGAGTDSVVADAAGVDVLDGFESVDRPPVVTPAPVDTAIRPVIIRGGRVKVNRAKRTVAIRISAPAGAGTNSTGSVRLLTAAAVRLGGVKAVLQLGSARYDLAPGTSATLKVKLPRGIQRLVDHRGRINVRAIASTGSAANAASSSRRLSLVFAAARGARH